MSALQAHRANVWMNIPSVIYQQCLCIFVFFSFFQCLPSEPLHLEFTEDGVSHGTSHSIWSGSYSEGVNMENK